MLLGTPGIWGRNTLVMIEPRRGGGPCGKTASVTGSWGRRCCSLTQEQALYRALAPECACSSSLDNLRLFAPKETSDEKSDK